MTSLARQQRPRTPHAPSVIGVSVVALAITILVVAAPTGAEGCIDFEHVVHEAKGVVDERGVRAANSITNQFEKTGIDDCVGRKFRAITGALICQDYRSTIWIFVGTVIDVAGIDTDVVPGYSGDQCS